MTTIYHNPRCGKSRQTLAILQEKGEEVSIVEYLKTQPDAVELEKIISMLGIKPEQLIRKGESIYKEHYKGKELSDQEWIAAMVQHPILIERPIVLKNGKAALGRPPENVETIL